MKYRCDSCGKEWDYPVKFCIFCGEPISKVDVTKYTVKGITQVFVPSKDHLVTPYYVMLLGDLNGSYKFQKTFEYYDIGAAVYAKGKKKEGYTIGIIGTGVTGKGIVEAAVKTGNKVVFKSRNEKSLEKAMETISKNLSKGMSPEELEITLGQIMVTTKYESLCRADLIIESVAEDLQVKNKIFQKLDSICDTRVILASNTSSLLISNITEGLRHPERVIWMHFFSPIPKMKLVEIVKTKKTSDNTLKKAHEFATKFNKVAVDVKDTSGFIVNRLLFMVINEACRMLDEGIASVEDIDRAMKMGANHPMGPFELADLIGLGLCLEIIENLNVSFGGNTFKSSSTLKSLVEEGHYGRKTGRGFYEY
ncbi:MAG: 3-hydroxyacyl-CoA dehydrogenase family protein [Candidatus Thermoplasmatota archaeon]|nr:3-hydroxyacyl-CoA dehydrogenase family protein [Candidatus Thermoplasmatota archaeon]